MIAQQEITDTLATYTADYTAQDELDDLRSLMFEIYSHLTIAAAALNAGLMETPGPVNRSPFADLAKAKAHVTYALSAWEPE